MSPKPAFLQAEEVLFPILSSQKCSTSVVSAEYAAADGHISSFSALQETMFKAGHCIPDTVCWVPSNSEHSLPLIPWFMLLLVSPRCCQPSLLPGRRGSSRLAPRQPVPDVHHFWRLVHPRCKTSVLAGFSEVPLADWVPLHGSPALKAGQLHLQFGTHKSSQGRSASSSRSLIEDIK